MVLEQFIIMSVYKIIKQDLYRYGVRGGGKSIPDDTRL